MREGSKFLNAMSNYEHEFVPGGDLPFWPGLKSSKQCLLCQKHEDEHYGTVQFEEKKWKEFFAK